MLLFIAAAFTFTSCGNDDDGGNQDRLIGIWTLENIFENGIEDPELTDCDRQETFSFDADGTAENKIYYQEDEDGPCVLDETETGTWENDGDGSYILTSEFGSFSVDITFEGNTFYFEDVYTDEGMTFTDRYVYIKN